jgi:hypothetical protein
LVLYVRLSSFIVSLRASVYYFPFRGHRCGNACSGSWGNDEGLAVPVDLGYPSPSRESSTLLGNYVKGVCFALVTIRP